MFPTIDILLVSSLQLHRGGIETHLRYMLPHLRSQFSLAIVSGATPTFQAELHRWDIPWFPWQAKHALDLPAALKLHRLIRHLKPALVHLQDARAAFLVRALLPPPRPPLLYTVHLPPYLYRFSGWQAWLRPPVYKRIESFLNRCCTTRVIYVSEQTYRTALQHGIVPKSKAVLLPNGIDVKRLKRYTKKPPVSSFRCCTTARLSYEKGVDLVLHTLAIAQQQTPSPLEAWIFGDGPERHALEVLTRQLGITRRVRIWGSLPQEELYPLLAQCSLFLLLSRYEGGRTYALMEAQALGLPAIVSAVGDHPFMVQHGENGFLVPREDVQTAAQALVWLIEHPETHRRMGEAAKRQAQRYDVHTQVQGLVRLYNTLIHHGSRRAQEVPYA